MSKKVLILCIGTLVLAGLVYLKPFRFFDNLFYDLNFAFFAEDAADSVLVVGIDSKSISEFGAMPWPRSQTAGLIEKIESGNPKAVALDFLFPRRPGKEENDSLAAVLSRTHNLVLPFRASGITSEEEAYNHVIPTDILNFRFFRLSNPQGLNDILFYTATEVDAADTLFTKYARYGGFLNVSTSNSSQKIREAIQVIKVGEEFFYSFGISAVAAYYGLPAKDIVLDGDGWIDLKHRKVPITSYAATTNINFRNQRHPIKEISAGKVLNGEMNPSIFKDKLVLVGVTDPLGGADFFITPVKSQFSGVSVWATLALDILQNSWIKPGSPLVTALNWLIMLMLFPGLALLFPAKKRILSITSSLLLLVASAIVGVVFFQYFHYNWEYSSHIYAWLFSVLWMAAIQANPELSGLPHLYLEPSENVGDDIIPPPQEDALSADLPQTDTSIFVTKALTEIDDVKREQDLSLSGTVIEQRIEDISGKPRKVISEPNIMEKVRELAGGKIIRALGTGGMADVYLIWNPRLELYRAVKVLKPDQTENYSTRFETEIRIFSKLDHPNIVQCYSVGEWHSLPYLEMEFVNGASADEVLRKCKILTVEQALAIGVLVCRALHYAHNQVVTIYGKTYKGVVHRDLKPANIMLNRSGRIKLTDFGIARPGTVSLHTIDLGSVVGTLPYLAPEQLAGGDLSARTDVYALGATLYEFITGERAFPHTEIPALISAKNKGTYKSLSSSVRISEEAVRVIDKALAIDPSLRYSSAHAFGLDLEKVLIGMTGQDGFKHLAMLIKRVWNG